MKKNLTWQEAKAAADKRLPVLLEIYQELERIHGTPDLIPMTDYESEDDYIKILGTETNWNWHEHRMVNKALGRALRKLKLPVKFFNLTAPEYFAWLGPRENTTEMRAQFAEYLAHHQND